MAYAAPDREDLRASVARDLRDPELKTFTAQEIDDLLNLSLVEVGRIYPKQMVEELSVDIDYQRQYETDASSIFRCEVMKDSLIIRGVPPNDHPTTSEGGYDLHGGTFFMPGYAMNGILAADDTAIRVWGYYPRALFSDDADILDGDAETEFAVRTYSVLQGYQRLQNDRLLFQQWLTNTGNTDVSPNQLAQTTDLYQSQWREQRNRLRSLQRQ